MHPQETHPQARLSVRYGRGETEPRGPSLLRPLSQDPRHLPSQTKRCGLQSAWVLVLRIYAFICLCIRVPE